MKPFLIILLIALTTTAWSQDGVVRHITVEELQPLRDSLPGAVVIDLRTPEEVRKGKIAGARVIDFFGPDFEPNIKALDRNKPYILYCASGGRSGETAELMKSLGFKHLYEMPEGFNGWKEKRKYEGRGTKYE